MRASQKRTEVLEILHGELETTQALIRVLGNLCGEGARYNWTCLDENEAGESRCVSSDTKCAWCEARDVLRKADPTFYVGGE